MSDAAHTPWSDPGEHRAALHVLPSMPVALADALEEFVIHHAVARGLGYGVPPAAEGDRDLRAATALLGITLGRDSRPLTEHRALPDYLYGTCHDFALLAASTLRERGVPARLRVGFASYFRSGRWEDHWVCEHQVGGTWAVLDAQLGHRAREGLRIGFDIADVPATGWRPAAAIWRAIRSGEMDAASCGVSHAGISGTWFAAASVLRDAAALAGIETLPWDYWGPARRFTPERGPTEDEARDLDALAAALDPAPADREAAEAVLARFPWARPTPTILSYPMGRSSSEVSLTP